MTANFDPMSPLTPEQRSALAAAAGGAEKRAYVRRIFSDIAPSYDLLNHLLSLNIDKGWRTKAIAMLGWERHPDGVFVDLCAGTMDVAVALAGERTFRGCVIGADFAEPMLRAGERKASRSSVRPVVADALQLPLADGTSAGVIVAFGARNFADLDAGLREAYRVLAPGARLVMLEFSRPRSALVRVLYHLYSHRVLPFIGGVISGHRTAYRYLPASVANFPPAEEIAARMRRAGFANVAWRTLTMGVVAVHVGERTTEARGRDGAPPASSHAMSA
jgi:demethylmenaquinone methyltransferase/2-methoxy-6-polyprenyl-1,4-benzoquinol methylase